jgi:predicted AAA+ superfamily ATPase
MWITRDIANILAQNTNYIEVLIGPRQCGKSSLLFRLDSDYIEISLDDFSLREVVAKDPSTFLSQFEGKKLIIDEVQLVPELFFALKRKVDLMKREGIKRKTFFRVTGSNQILIDKNVKESLAGRASYFELNTLSVAEITHHLKLPIGEIILKGGWPELYADSSISTKRYLDDYIRSYVEKDIVLSAGIQKQNEFIRFAKLLAARTAHLVNHSELAKEVGVSSDTIKDWLSILERMKIIVLINPYFSNFSKRLVKSAKVYFLDTGLACRLQGHYDLVPLLSSPAFGHLFETLVCAEIYKTMINFSRNWQIFHWRSRDGEEIDFLIELENGKKLFIEAKTKRQSLEPLESFSELKKVFQKNTPPRYVCHMEGETILGEFIPISCLRDFLLNF